MVAGRRTAGLLAVATTVSATVLELPVITQNTYSSVEFEIGTPPKTYRLEFDTGSATSWVVDAKCGEEACPNSSGYKRQPYSQNASSTSVDMEAEEHIGYLGGAVSGHTYQDVFSVPGSNLEWNQTFLSANESQWRFITADGFLGLGFSSIAEPSTSPVVEGILWNRNLDAPRFALYYGSDLNKEDERDGVLTIGGSHEDEYVEGGKDGMVYFPLRKETPYQLWRGALRSINIMTQPNATLQLHTGSLPTVDTPAIVYPGSNTTWPTYTSGGIVFDTGAGDISIPDTMIEAVYYNLGWNYSKLISHEEVMECKHFNASWAISFTIGEEDEKDDVTFSLRGDEIWKKDQQCMPPFGPSGGDAFALIGTSFLQRYYSVFDYGSDVLFDYEPKIGFGRLKKEKDLTFPGFHQ